MIEIVAKAISAVMWSEAFEGSDDIQREFIRDAARAAIAAMREPTPEMLGAGYEEMMNSAEARVSPESELIWKAMIDAALADETNPAGPGNA